MAGEFWVEVRTAHLPTLRLDSAELLAPGGDAGVPWWAAWLRPEVRLGHPFGVLQRAPYGPPGASTWPLLGIVVALLVVLGLGLAVYGAVSLLRR